MYELSLIGSIGSIVPVDIMYSAIMDCQSSGWGNLNSITLVNNPDGGHIWYSLLFGSEYRVWTGAVWLAIARNNSGTWEYWDGAAWQAAQINSAQTAISDAMAMAGNRMFGETLAALVDADFAGTYPDGLAVTLFTSDSANNQIGRAHV